MIFLNELENSYANNTLYNITGCKRLFLLKSDYLTSYTLKDYQVLTLNTSRAWNLFEGVEGLSYTVKAETAKAGVLYNVEVSFKIAGIEAFTSEILDRLMNTPLTAIIEDENSRFFLLGFRQGLEGVYDYSSEDAGYTVKLTTKQVHSPEEVSISLMKTLAYNAQLDNTTPTPVYNIPVTSGSGSGTGSGSDNVMKTVQVTYNNYAVGNTDHLLLVTGAYLVLLPTNPLQGQVHKIKAVYDASVEPVRIKAAGTTIDGVSEVEINTDLGSVEVTHFNSRWHTTAFVV